MARNKLSALRALYAYRDDIFGKMESKNGKRLKRDDGVRAGGEGNVTNFFAVPILEEHVPGI